MHHKNIKNRSARFKLNPICLSCWSAWGWLSCICLALVTLLLLSPTVTESDYPANTQYAVDQTFKIAHTPILQGAFDGASGTASQNYYSAPLHYVNAGNIVINLGALRNVGTYGDLWSSTAYYESDYEPSIKNAFYNSFSYYSVAPAYALYRHQGYSVRCLAR